jgi:outer membrane protein OmpA-like peptidoglycan-associated protein
MIASRGGAWRCFAVAIVALLAGCATPQGSVVLLPDALGQPTAVTVTQGGDTTTLDRPYAAARLTSQGPQPYQADRQQVEQRFGAALAARPLPPAQFTLYFVEGKDEFTDASKAQIDGVFTEIARRPVPDVLIIGHPDKLGTDAYNDALSHQRAEVVRDALVARGIAQQYIVVIGRGKREPIVPTAEGVAEARNRRVEILVR